MWVGVTALVFSTNSLELVGESVLGFYMWEFSFVGFMMAKDLAGL